MSFWKQLLGLEPAAPPMPAVARCTDDVPEAAKPQEKKDISEPVLALVKTIQNDEWELTRVRTGYSGTDFEARHCWLNKTMKFEVCNISFKGLTCGEVWMTEDERKLVAKEMWEASTKHNRAHQELHNRLVRESFMIFTQQGD